jgi:exonuclease VII large subunit
LKRGYAIVRKNGVPVTHAHQLVRSDEAVVEFQDGTVKTKVQ